MKFFKEPILVSDNLGSLANTRLFSSYKGRKVFSKTGDLIGRVKDLVIEKNSLAGFKIGGKVSLIIGREFVATDTPEALLLSMDPVPLLVGKQVFDAKGRLLGVVSSLDRKTFGNTFSSLVVKRRFYSKPIVIPKDRIDVCEKNIILKKSWPRK